MANNKIKKIVNILINPLIIYITLISITCLLLVSTYNSFRRHLTYNIATRKAAREIQINMLRNLQLKNPKSMIDIINYDRKYHTNLLGLLVQTQAVINHTKYKNKNPTDINSDINKAILTNEKKILADDKISNSLWLNLPAVNTLILAALGIFFTSLINNFGNYCSKLINGLKNWSLIRIKEAAKKKQP